MHALSHARRTHTHAHTHTALKLSHTFTQLFWLQLATTVGHLLRDLELKRLYGWTNFFFLHQNEMVSRPCVIKLSDTLGLWLLSCCFLNSVSSLFSLSLTQNDTISRPWVTLSIPTRLTYGALATQWGVFFLTVSPFFFISRKWYHLSRPRVALSFSTRFNCRASSVTGHLGSCLRGSLIDEGSAAVVVNLV